MRGSTHPALAGNHGPRGLLRVRSLEELRALHSSTDLHSGTVVVTRATVSAKKLNVLKAVGVDGEGAGAGATGLKVVTGVTDDKADIARASKVDTFLDVLLVLGHDHVLGVVSHGAGGRRIVGQLAGVVTGPSPDSRSRTGNSGSVSLYLEDVPREWECR